VGDRLRLKSGDALIVIDVQRDFLPDGSLAVPGGDAVVPVLNEYLRRFHSAGLPTIATRDWHPADHCSFVAQGGSWPAHCVQDSPGAQFAEALRLPDDALLVSKATKSDADAYSGFEGTDLARRLRDAKIKRVFIGGLATDYCVLATVRDAILADFDVFVLRDAVRAVNVECGDGDKALEEMRALGASLIELHALDAAA
jgi:nicotinamidase/pyrazinamidase